LNVDIKIDNQALELNDFVQKVIFNVISGLMESLRDVPEWQSIEIKLDK
jgi:hypothetical protein